MARFPSSLSCCLRWNSYLQYRFSPRHPCLIAQDVPDLACHGAYRLVCQGPDDRCERFLVIQLYVRIAEDHDLAPRLGNRPVLGGAFSTVSCNLTSRTPHAAKPRTISSVRSVEPSETTMISSRSRGYERVRELSSLSRMLLSSL